MFAKCLTPEAICAKFRFGIACWGTGCGMAGALKRAELMWLFARSLGVEFDDLDQFEGRKKFQKLIYLLQQPPFGKDLGYRYNLYIHGPYSPDLAADGYAIAGDRQRFQHLVRRYHLRPQTRSVLDDLRTHFVRDGRWDTNFLELCATVHFLYSCTYAYIPQDTRLTLVRATAKRTKPHLADRIRECLQALRSAKMLG
jgi:hypothetical protein